ncbi:MAG: hypothetical protein E5Y79_09845 [Mesorhizobium sp.]|nr:MAG: hypothetical protein E5Y79_09845 [Mesorhizobium sp.]
MLNDAYAPFLFARRAIAGPIVSSSTVAAMVLRHDKSIAGSLPTPTEADPDPPSQYLGNSIEQDHRRIKRRVRPIILPGKS